MAAIAYRLRAELRRSWRSALGVVVLIGLLAGVTLAAVAGARRTASAYPRLLDEVDAAELLVSPFAESGTDVGPFYDEVAALPGVERVGVAAGMPALPLAGSLTAEAAERLGRSDVFEIQGVASIDRTAFREIGRPQVVEGRLPDPARADEVLVSGRLAELAGFEVGDILDFVVVPNEFTDVKPVADADDGQRLRVEVVGIGVLATEVIPFSDLDAFGTMLFTPAAGELAPRKDWGFEGIQVDVAPGTDVAALGERIERMGAASPLTGGTVFVSDLTANAAEVQDGLRPLAVALAMFAVVVGLVALFVVGQAVTRHTRLSAAEAGALSSLGMVPTQRVAVTLLRALVVAVGGAALAVAIAIALSPRFPNGPARVAEPDPGVHLDLPALVLGGVAIVLVTVAAVVPGALLRTRRPTAPPLAAVAVSATSARAGLPAPAVQGIRFALDRGSGASRAPVRSTLVTIAAAMAAVLAAATFATSLGLLVDTPARYGQRWDRMLDSQFGLVPAGLLAERYRDDPRVAGMAVGAYAEVGVGDRTVPAVSMVSITGDAGVTIARGEPADGPGEIVLGGEVLEDLGLEVGDRVDVDDGTDSRSMRIVGEAVFPRFNQGSFGQTGLGLGAQVHPDAIAPLEPDPEMGPLPPEFLLDRRYHSFAVFDLAEDPAALDGELRTLVEDNQLLAFLRTDLPPTTISDLDRVRTVPVVLAAVLAVAAAVVLGHLIVSGVRSHRRDLAVLATCGFVPRQLRATVGWHATVVAVVASVIGIPLGVAAGRVLWSRFADGIHAASPAAVPWWWVALAAPVAVVVANALAALPGGWAARTRPATALREE
jgi:ABC-type lipoprotein release transport system permease subunit